MSSAVNIGLAIVAVVVLVLGAVHLDALNFSASHPIQFVEPFTYNALGNDRANLNGEFLTIENQGDEPVELSEWTLESDAGKRFVFPDGFTLEPRERVTIYTGCGENTNADLYWCSPVPIWDDKVGLASLYTADGDKVAVYGYDVACTTCQIKRRN